MIDIQVLKRTSSDNRSCPDDVIDLLTEYVDRRDDPVEPDALGLPENIYKKYSKEQIFEYLNEQDSLEPDLCEAMDIDFTKIGYGLAFIASAKKYSSPDDRFAVVIDRDSKTHSAKMLKEVIADCKSHGFDCYISNPCFEIWLLMHRVDIEKEYAEDMDVLKSNPKISDAHTWLSNEISRVCHHGKKHIDFETDYLEYVDAAIEQAKKYESSELGLVENVGSNIWKLIEDMRSK